jgi:hypothetical protein
LNRIESKTLVLAMQFSRCLSEPELQSPDSLTTEQRADVASIGGAAIRKDGYTTSRSDAKSVID